MKFQFNTTLFVIIVCGLGLFTDGYDLYISAITEPFVSVAFHPDPVWLGLMQAAAPIGAAIGAIAIGYAADRFGRKPMLVLNLFGFVILALLSACAWSIASLCVFRFMLGFLVGADYPICAAYLVEMVPKAKSRVCMASIMFLNCLAAPIGVFAAYVILHLYPHVNAWRLMFATGAIPAFIGMTMRMQLSESVLWELHNKAITLGRRSRLSLQKNIQAIFSNQRRRSTTIFSLCWFLKDVSYYGVFLFTPFILQVLHFHSQDSFIGNANELIKGSLLINVFFVLGALCSIPVISRVECLRLQKFGFFVAFLGLLLLSISHYHFGLIFLGFIIYNFFINLGPGVTTYILPAEYYPTTMKATGHGFSAGMAKFGAGLGALCLPMLQVAVGMEVTLVILALFLCCAGGLSFMLPTTVPAS